MGEAGVALRAALRRVLGRTRSHPATTVLAISGVTSGVAALLVVLAVMNGLQLNTIEDILEVSSYHLRLAPVRDGSLSARTGARLASLPELQAVVPFYDVQSLASGERSPTVIPLQVRLLPADVAERDRELFAHARLTQGAIDLSPSGGILIGWEAARLLRVTVGDRVQLSTLAAGPALQPVTGGLEVTGTFQTRYRPLDAGWAFTSPALWEQLAGAAPPDVTYGIKLRNPFAIADAVAAVTAVLETEGWAPDQYRLDTWRSFNRAFFGALRVEKLLMAVLVGMIFLVVSFGILQALRRRVVERTEEIGLLLALGARPWSVQLAFVLEGAAIGVAGSVAGTALGLAISSNFAGVLALVERAAGAVVGAAQTLVLGQAGDPVSLLAADSFYLIDVPTRLLPSEVALVAALAVAVPACAGVVAARRTAVVRPSVALRAE